MEPVLKTKVKEKGPTTRVVEVELPEEVVARKLDEVYRRVVRDLELPGFRRGRIPRPLLVARFGKEILYNDSQEELIEEYLPRALQEAELRPVSRPQARVIQFEEGQPFIFEAEVEVLPEVEVEGYLGIEVEPEPKPQVAEEEVEGELTRMRREQATIVPKSKEDVVEPGDVVIATRRIVDRRSGEVTTEENVEVEVEVKFEEEGEGEGDPLSAELLGKRIGDEVEVPLDEERTSYWKIEEVKRVELPPLDDEFALDLGYKSLEELKSKVHEELQAQLERDYEHKMKLKVLDELIARTPVVLPERLIDELVRRDLELLQEGSRGYTPTEEELADYKRRKIRQLKRELVLEAIKRREGLQLSEEEFDRRLAEEAERRGMSPLKLRALLEREGGLERFRRELEEERVLDFLYKNAIIKEKSEKEQEQEPREKSKREGKRERGQTSQGKGG